MADSKWRELKEEKLERETKSCQAWKKNAEREKHFENFQGNLPEITDKPTEKNY